MEDKPKRFGSYDFGEKGKRIYGTNIIVKNAEELSDGLEYVMENSRPMILKKRKAYYFKNAILPKVILDGFTNLYVADSVVGELVMRRANVVDMYDCMIDRVRTEDDGYVKNLWIDESEIYDELAISKTEARQLAVLNSYMENVRIKGSRFTHMHFRNMSLFDLRFNKTIVENKVTMYDTYPKYVNIDNSCEVTIDMKS